MNKTTKAASTIMQSESLEEPIEQPNPEKALPTESQMQKPQPLESQPLTPSQQVDAAYKLVYGEGAQVPTKHESIVTAQDAEWQIRHYMGGLFAVPNNHSLTQEFPNVDELWIWFDRTYPVQQEVSQE